MRCRELFKAKDNKRTIETSIKEIDIAENDDEIHNIIGKRIGNNIAENNAKILESELMKMIANALLTLKKMYNNNDTRFKSIEQGKVIQLMIKKKKNSLIILLTG